MQTTDQHLIILQFKALGDFVIAAQCIGRREIAGSFEVLAGEHLSAIADALNVNFSLRLFEHDERAIPALIAMKSQGIRRAARSAISLKKALNRTAIPQDSLVVFDKLDKRETFLALGMNSIALPASDNIYLAYDRFFDERGCATRANANQDSGSNDGPLRIYPGSRLPERHVPIGIVSDLLGIASALGMPAELMLLEGERPDLEDSGLPFTRVTRTFPTLMDSIRGAGRIVSADSMPAHLAEYLGKPVFVYSPTLNRYWLPRSSFCGGWDALFGEGGASDQVRRFMTS